MYLSNECSLLVSSNTLDKISGKLSISSDHTCVCNSDKKTREIPMPFQEPGEEPAQWHSCVEFKYQLWRNNIHKIYSLVHWPMAFVSSRFAFNIENLNFARTSVLLHDTRSRYSDKYSLLSSSSPFGLTLKHLMANNNSAMSRWCRYTETFQWLQH